MLVGLSEQERAGMVDKTVKGAAEPAGTEAAPVALGPSGNVLAEQARVGTARGAAAPNAVPPAERTVALPPPLAPPPAPPPAPPGPGRTGRTLVALLVGIVLGVAGTWGFNATFPPGRADAVPGTAPPSALPRPEPSAAPPAETATAGAEVTVLLKVSPSSATVTVDGTLVVPEDGLVEITGKSGSRHKVVLRAGPTETPFDVVIDETGPEPAEVALGSPPASAPAPVGAAPPTPPTGGTPAPAPPPAATPPPASPASVPATSPAAPAPKPAIVATPPPAPVPAVKPTPPAPPPPAKPAPKPAAGDEYE
ncbi:MAG: hypothetical protein HY744_29595 [Deltaproteobacteria bacterium]|nr:hypothetical protein [Deltaproteobacteria bacterium]